MVCSVRWLCCLTCRGSGGSRGSAGTAPRLRPPQGTPWVCPQPQKGAAGAAPGLCCCPWRREPEGRAHPAEAAATAALAAATRAAAAATERRRRWRLSRLAQCKSRPGQGRCLQPRPPLRWTPTPLPAPHRTWQPRAHSGGSQSGELCWHWEQRHGQEGAPRSRGQGGPGTRRSGRRSSIRRPATSAESPFPAAGAACPWTTLTWRPSRRGEGQNLGTRNQGKAEPQG